MTFIEIADWKDIHLFDIVIEEVVIFFDWAITEEEDKNKFESLEKYYTKFVPNEIVDHITRGCHVSQSLDQFPSSTVISYKAMN